MDDCVRIGKYELFYDPMDSSFWIERECGYKISISKNKLEKIIDEIYDREHGSEKGNARI
jgi:hypothetical protein